MAEPTREQMNEVLARSINHWDARLVRKYNDAAFKYMTEMAGAISVSGARRES